MGENSERKFPTTLADFNSLVDGDISSEDMPSDSIEKIRSILSNQLYLAMIIYRKTLVTSEKEKNPLMSTVKLIEAEDGKSAQKKLEEHWTKAYRAFAMIKVELSEVIK